MFLELRKMRSIGAIREYQKSSETRREKCMRIGIRAHDVKADTFEGLVKEIHNEGMHCCQLAVPKAVHEFPTKKEVLTPGMALYMKEVFAENKLFATLDTTVRKVIVDNLPFLLSDTVGFIRKLPTHLVDSFKSTLDEVREADLLLHIVDISHPAFEEQIEVVNKTLQEVCDSTDKPMILVFNKIDAFSYVEKAADDLTPKTRENITLDEWKETWMGKMHDNCIFISAKEKKNIDELKTLLYQRVKEIHTTRFPYNDFLFQHYDEITTDEES